MPPNTDLTWDGWLTWRDLAEVEWSEDSWSWESGDETWDFWAFSTTPSPNSGKNIPTAHKVGYWLSAGMKMCFALYFIFAFIYGRNGEPRRSQRDPKRHAYFQGLRIGWVSSKQKTKEPLIHTTRSLFFFLSFHATHHRMCFPLWILYYLELTIPLRRGDENYA